MSRTTTLRRQHDFLSDCAAQLTAMARVIRTPADAEAAVALLAKMAGVVHVHLAAEDKSLYPRMMASTHPVVAETARRFSRRMGSLAQSYGAYVERWSTAGAIIANPAGFREHTESVMAALGTRIQMENETLYPLADAMCAVPDRSAA